MIRPITAFCLGLLVLSLPRAQSPPPPPLPPALSSSFSSGHAAAAALAGSGPVAAPFPGSVFSPSPALPGMGGTGPELPSPIAVPTPPRFQPGPAPGLPPGVRVISTGNGGQAGPPVQRTVWTAPGIPGLKWDSVFKEHQAKLGDLEARLSFSATNISTTAITITQVRTSCGCTVARAPAMPWHLAPQQSGTIDVTVDLRGKYGMLTKIISIDSDSGFMFLTVRLDVPTTPEFARQQQQNMQAAARARNIAMAAADRQAVFKGACANCHLKPAEGKLGQSLYRAACAICHNSPHRATMVPDLARAAKTNTVEYWTAWITQGKAGTLMPAFSKKLGGPLSGSQIDSLARFLVGANGKWTARR